MSETLLKPEEVSRALKISRPYVYKLVATGMLPAVVWQVPGAGERRKVIRIRTKDLETFISKHYSGKDLT